jgi:cellulose biosynthesis protein BcsQ
MLTIDVDTDKGGETKTTDAAHLGWYFAGAGLRVGMIDNDNNRGLTNTLSERREGVTLSRRSILDVYVHPEQLLSGALVAISEGDERLAAHIPAQHRKERRPGSMHLVPGARSLYRAVGKFAQQPNPVVSSFTGTLAYVLRHPDVQAAFDVFIIDNAPGWDEITQAGLRAADQIITPVTPAVLSLNGLEDYLERVYEADELSGVSRNRLLGAVVSRVNQSLARQREFASQLPSALASKGIYCFKTPIPETDAVYSSPLAHAPAWVIDPHDAGARAMLSFCGEVFDRLWPN